MEEPLRTPAASRCHMTEMVLPNDTNIRNTLFGGRLLSLMDKCAAISAMRHAGNLCVTAGIDSVDFWHPINLGDAVMLNAWVNRAFRTSLEVEVTVQTQNLASKELRHCNHAFFSFVSIDEDGMPKAVPAIHPQTEEEAERYKLAALRRELRLYQKGHIRLVDAKLIKEEIFAALAIKDFK